MISVDVEIAVMPKPIQNRNKKRPLIRLNNHIAIRRSPNNRILMLGFLVLLELHNHVLLMLKSKSSYANVSKTKSTEPFPQPWPSFGQACWSWSPCTWYRE